MLTEIKAQTNVAGILTTEIIRPVSQADAIGSSTLNWWVVGV